jgi:4-hydroxy-tetrahydrodipicolinate synthase
LFDFRGIHVTTVTPFVPKTYDLDLRGLAENISFLSDSAGISSIVPIGTVGEFPSMSTEERKKVTKTVVDAANGKKPIIVGVSHTSLTDVIDLARYAKDSGAHSVLLVPPTYYMKDRDEGLIEFLDLVSRRIDIGVVLYNVPGQSRTNLTPGLLMKLLQRVENIVAVKDATKDLSQLAETIKTVGKRIPVVVGAEELMYYGLLAGGVGATSSVANFAPDKVGELFEANHMGNHEKAKSLYFDFLVPFRHMDINSVIQGIPIQIAQTKETMNLLGLSGGTVRPPLCPLTQEQGERLKSILADLEILPSMQRSIR